MLSLIRKLRKSLPVAANRSRTARRTRPTRPVLGVEALDQRLLPSVTASLSGGVLTVTGNASNDHALVAYGLPDDPAVTWGTPSVFVSGNVAGGTSFHGLYTYEQFKTSQVQTIRFIAGSGAESFDNNTSIPTQAYGSGQATLDGGTGANTFWIKNGDTIVPNGSNNVTYGLVGGHLTPAELGAQGQLAASLSGTTLTLSGPGGAGFRIVGNWKQSGTGSSAQFTASGNLTLDTAVGNLPFYAMPVLPLTVSYSADSTNADEGVVQNISLAGNFPNLNVNGTGPLSALSNETGINVSLPNAGLGIALGSSLGSLALPVNAGVPYFYATFNNGFSASFGGANVSTQGDNLSIAIDPADPSVVARWGSVAVGGSLKGYIPFVPVAQPTATVNTPIFGNLYGEADNIQPDPEIPLTISGSFVLNLDAKNTGSPLEISGNTFSKLVNGQESYGQLASNALNDLALGVNGTLSLGYDLKGFNITVPLANATVMYSPGLLAARGQTADIFAGTPLEQQGGLLGQIAQSVASQATYSVDGSIAWDSKGFQNWHVTAEAQNVPLAFGFTAKQATFTLANTGISADVQVASVLNLATFDLNGSLNSDGSFSLTASAQASVGPFNGTFNFTFTNETGPLNKMGLPTIGSVELTASLTGSCHVHVGAIETTVKLKADLSFSVDSSDDIDVSGSAKVSCFFGSASVGVSDSGFSVSLPVIGKISVHW
jgi:hypothetical protein